MERDIIERMRREEAELLRKLEAVRGILRAYSGGPVGATINDGAKAEARKSATRDTSSSQRRTREKMPLERFSSYGQSIVKAAIDECVSHLGRPIPSRDMVVLVERRGIEVQGKDQANAISALLARSADLMPNGRKGWTLSDEYQQRRQEEIVKILGTRPHAENEPHSAFAGGSDLAHGAPTKEITE